MSKVIAVQADQMKSFNEIYNKNAQPLVNNANVVSDSLNIPTINQTFTPIDMETQTVNLNPSVEQPSVTNVEVTNEVFGSQAPADFAMPVFPGSPLENMPINESQGVSVAQPTFSSEINVPYQEPILNSSVPANAINDDSYIELLNSLRNMITEFANNAYAAIDKYQEEKLQGKNTGADLINSVNNPVVQNNIPIAGDAPNTNVVNSVSQNDVNSFNTQSSDLDNTIVIPGSVISNAINEIDSEIKLAA